MQEMFDQLKASRNDEYGFAFAIDMFLENEQEMLKKEKEVIMDAYDYGFSDAKSNHDHNKRILQRNL